MRYKKPGVSSETFHEHGSKFHGPKAAIVQARHGAVKVTQYHTPTALRDMIKEKTPWAVQPGFKIDDHDAMISVCVRKTDDLVAIVMDPDFQALVAGDAEVTDMERGTVTAGWEEVYVEDGKIVNVDEDGKSTYPTFAECLKASDESKRMETPADIVF